VDSRGSALSAVSSTQRSFCFEYRGGHVGLQLSAMHADITKESKARLPVLIERMLSSGCVLLRDSAERTEARVTRAYRSPQPRVARSRAEACSMHAWAPTDSDRAFEAACLPRAQVPRLQHAVLCAQALDRSGSGRQTTAKLTAAGERLAHDLARQPEATSKASIRHEHQRRRVPADHRDGPCDALALQLGQSAQVLLQIALGEAHVARFLGHVDLLHAPDERMYRVLGPA